MAVAVSRAWSLSPKGVKCYRWPESSQYVGKLWEAEALTSLHDAELAEATKEINDILDGLKKNNTDPDRELSFIEFQNRHFLVWATYGSVGPYDDEAKIAKALGLNLRS